MSEAQICKVVPARFCGVKEVVSLHRRKLVRRIYFFSFFTYTCLNFCKLISIHLLSFFLAQLPAEKSSRGQPWAKEYSSLRSGVDAPGADEEEEFRFEFRKQTFWYSGRDNIFKKLSFPTKESLEVYTRCKGYGSEPKVQAATEKWGKNMCVFCKSFLYFLFCRGPV